MIGVNGELSILDLGNLDDFSFAALIVHFNRRSDTAKLRRHVGNVIGKRQSGIMPAKPIVRIDLNRKPITRRFAFQCCANGGNNVCVGLP